MTYVEELVRGLLIAAIFLGALLLLLGSPR